MTVLSLPAVLGGGEAAVLLGCGAKLGSQLWEGAAARAEDVCSLHVLTSQRGTGRIGFRVCRSGFHYTTVLVAAACVRSSLVGCSWWGGLLPLGMVLCDQMNRRKQDSSVVALIGC